MAIAFAPRLAFHGFAQFVTPKWQMVPVGGVRRLKLSGVGTMVLRVRDPSIVTAVQVKSAAGIELTLTGVKAGLTSVEWVANAEFAGPVAPGFQLDVSVKTKKDISTAFFYVDDGHVQKTRRRPADIDALIVRVNAILTPQANVAIVKRSAAALAVAQNLGKVVRFASHLTGPPDNVPAAEDEWDDLLALRDAAADFNVFFVKQYEQDNTPRQDNTEAGTIAADRMCIFEDNVSSDTARTLAHETVHGLGVHGHENNAIFLMATGASGLGRLLTRTQSDLINTSGT
jgi:hypothetical protein